VIQCSFCKITVNYRNYFNLVYVWYHSDYIRITVILEYIFFFFCKIMVDNCNSGILIVMSIITLVKSFLDLCEFIIYRMIYLDLTQFFYSIYLSWSIIYLSIYVIFNLYFLLSIFLPFFLSSYVVPLSIFVLLDYINIILHIRTLLLLL
jgi:hypothetical protein